MSAQLILIGGVSRSGKTRIAEAICARYNHCAHVDQDDFVRSKNELPTIQDRFDWEQPESIDWPRLIQHINQLEETNDIIIVEGIFAFCHTELNKRADLKVYLRLGEADFLNKRKQETRWGAEPDWYIYHVWQAHENWKNPYNISFDLQGNASEQLIDQLISSLR